MNPGTVKALFFSLVVMAAIFEATGDILLKKWAIDHGQWFLWIGLAVYFASTVVWALSLQYEFLSKAISIAVLINLIVVILVGVLYFKEDISFTNKIGMILGIISIYLIQK